MKVKHVKEINKQLENEKEPTETVLEGEKNG